MEDEEDVICLSDDEDEAEDDEDWNEREILKRVLELSKLEAAGPEGQRKNEDRKRALEVSLQCEPLINQTLDNRQEVLELSDDDEDNTKTEEEVLELSNVQYSKTDSPVDGAGDYDYIEDIFTDLANIEKSQENERKENKNPPTVEDSDSDIEEVTYNPKSGEEKDGDPSEDLDSVVITDVRPGVSKAPEALKQNSSLLQSKFGGAITVTQVKVPEESHREDVTTPSEENQHFSFEDPVQINSTNEEEPSITDECPEMQSDNVMSTEEVATRMRNVFESSLRLQLTGEEMEASNAISTALYPHQRVALAWMVGHEKNETDGMRGGILADDMGLGKTLTVLALILTNHWDDRPLAVRQAGYSRRTFTCQRKPYRRYKRKMELSQDTEKKKKKKRDSAKDMSSSSGDEFDQMSKDNLLSEKLNGTSSTAFETQSNPLKDIVFHCTDSESDTELNQAQDYDDGDDDSDVASMIPSNMNLDGLMDSESETEEVVVGRNRGRRKHTNPASVIFYSDSEVSDGGSRSPSPERTGLKVIVPPAVAAVRRGRRRASLVVCPTSLISQWVDQLETHTHHDVNIQLKVHHGGGKAVTGSELESHDIVITTYGTLAAESDLADLSPLMRAKWLRVVLDEGHMIKNHTAKCARAARELDTVRKWVVTGTPIQNNLMELWSLVNWLGFGVYSGRQEMGLFKEQIELPCRRGSLLGFQRLQVLVSAVCLRRTKTDKTPGGDPLVCLPAKQILTRRVNLNREERTCYRTFHTKAREIVSRLRRRGELLRNYAHVFALMTRLRQLCCHRDLIKDLDWAEALRSGLEAGEESRQERVARLREMIGDGVSEDCSLCLSHLTHPVITDCGHVFCKVCIETFLLTCRPSRCPLCLNSLNKSQLVEPTPERHKASKAFLADMEDIKVEVSSSKVNAVLRELLRIMRDCPSDKVVLVSQFTSFLSILQPVLREKLPSVPFTRLDGSMSLTDRAKTLKTFQSNRKSSPRILLLSLKAGGVGLNLTAANHLMLTDPAWNPASEWQCFDRIHRLGQTKQVFIYKFITKESVEEKMLDIQEKKQGLISGAFHIQEEEKRKRRVDDIINIFSL